MDFLSPLTVKYQKKNRLHFCPFVSESKWFSKTYEMRYFGEGGGLKYFHIMCNTKLKFPIFLEGCKYKSKVD